MRENRTCSLGGGRRPARKRASSDPTPLKVENRRAPGKGRPRYPLEGRGEQVDVSMRDYIHETQNSVTYVKWNWIE
jgi:hypothetical protein